MKSEKKQADKELNKERLFQAELPKSRVQLDIVKEIEAKIAEMPKNLPNKIITYQKIISENGEYYLLSASKHNLEPLSIYLYKNSINAQKLLLEYQELLTMVKDFENIFRVFPDGINAANFWLDEKENIYLMPEIFLRTKLNYGQFDFDIPRKEYYRPPEIIGGKNWDQTAYIFNLTAVFYYFLSGHPIFRDHDRAKILNKIQSEKILELKTILPQITAELNKLIKAALIKKPAKRIKIEKLIAEITDIAAQNNFKINPFLEQKKLINNKILGRKKIKENTKLFLRQSWKLIVFFILIGGVFIWGLFSKPQPIVTSQNTALEVVNYFYQGVARKNISLIKETTTLDLAEMERIITESHVVEKMQSVYANNLDENENINEVYSLEKLEIKKLFKEEKEAEYQSFYEFNFRDREGRYSVNLNDQLYLEKIEGIWKITAIEGSFNKMINGNYPWEE